MEPQERSTQSKFFYYSYLLLGGGVGYISSKTLKVPSPSLKRALIDLPIGATLLYLSRSDNLSEMERDLAGATFGYILGRAVEEATRKQTVIEGRGRVVPTAEGYIANPAEQPSGIANFVGSALAAYKDFRS